MDKYLKSIRDNVCSICVDSTEKGHCSLNAEETCAVQIYLPEIVKIINSIESDSHQDYYQPLKDGICSKCETRSEESSCYLKEDANCSIDRYYSIIVDAVKAAKKN